MSINLANNDTTRSARASRRRSFLKLMTASFVGVAGWTAGVGRFARAESNQFEPLWKSAKVLELFLMLNNCKSTDFVVPKTGGK
jgi:hypothetical protein